MRKTGRATGVPNRLCRREEIPHPPRDFLSPPPHRRKKGQILEPDRSRANRTGHLDVLTIELKFTIDIRPNLWYLSACYLKQIPVCFSWRRRLSLNPSIVCRLLKSLASLFPIPILCFQ